MAHELGGLPGSLPYDTWCDGIGPGNEARKEEGLDLLPELALKVICHLP